MPPIIKCTSRHRDFRNSNIKHRLATSWPISALWVFLSLSLAVLSTFSFLQADWIVKRELVVSSFTTNVHNGTETGLIRISHRVDISNEEFSKFLQKYTGIEYENETIFYDQYFNRISKVTKVITTVRFGLIGVCTSPNGIVQCFLYDRSSREFGNDISQIWPILMLVGGSGCVTFCVCAVLSILAVALPSSHMRHQVAKTIGHAQTVAVVLLMLSLLGFPFGFTSSFVRHHCGESTDFYKVGDCEIGWAYALVLVSTSLSLYCPVLVHFTAEIRYGLLPKYL